MNYVSLTVSARIAEFVKTVLQVFGVMIVTTVALATTYASVVVSVRIVP